MISKDRRSHGSDLFVLLVYLIFILLMIELIIKEKQDIKYD